MVVCGSRKPSRADMESAREGFPIGGSCRRQATDEGRACHGNPFAANHGNLAPHPASGGASATFPPLGKGTLQLIQRFPEELQLRLDGIHQGVELVGGQALGTVALGLGRVIVGLDH